MKARERAITWAHCIAIARTSDSVLRVPKKSAVHLPLGEICLVLARIRVCGDIDEKKYWVEQGPVVTLETW